MPIYTYRCQNCGVQFEYTQKFTDASLELCPECGMKTLHKVYLPVGIVFKGSGFYATDHKSPSGAPRLANSSESKSTTESSNGDGKESKPAVTEKPAVENNKEAKSE